MNVPKDSQWKIKQKNGTMFQNPERTCGVQVRFPGVRRDLKSISVLQKLTVV